MGNYYSLYSKNLGLSGKMVWWSTEPNWSTKLGDLSECLKLTLTLSKLYFRLIAVWPKGGNFPVLWDFWPKGATDF